MFQPAEFLGLPLDSEDSYTLSVVRDGDALLLGRKTRGFGMGKLVLPGGKNKHYLGAAGIGLTPVIDDAAREVREELGVATDRRDFSQVGMLHIATEDDGRDIAIMQTKHTGATVTGSDELAEVGWHRLDQLPYGSMPADYKLWLPHILAGYAVTAFLQTEHGNVLDAQVYRQQLEPLGRLELISDVRR